MKDDEPMEDCPPIGEPYIILCAPCEGSIQDAMGPYRSIEEAEKEAAEIVSSGCHDADIYVRVARYECHVVSERKAVKVI